MKVDLNPGTWKLRTRSLYYNPDVVQSIYLCQEKYYWFSYFLLFFNRKFPIFPIFVILSFLFSYFIWATMLLDTLLLTGSSSTQPLEQQRLSRRSGPWVWGWSSGNKTVISIGIMIFPSKWLVDNFAGIALHVTHTAIANTIILFIIVALPLTPWQSNPVGSV